jgi:hypothetical protein
MNALKAPFLIIGYIASLLGLSALYEAPDASDEVLAAPPATVQVYEYGEMPVIESTTTSTSTTVWVEPQPKSECEQALQLALDVGWPAEEMATLARVLWRESRCTPGPVHNPDDPMGGSYGLLQINGFWCEPSKSWPVGWLQAKGIVTDCDDLYSSETNLRAGLAIWQNSAWHPWAIK